MSASPVAASETLPSNEVWAQAANPITDRILVSSIRLIIRWSFTDLRMDIVSKIAHNVTKILRVDPADCCVRKRIDTISQTNLYSPEYQFNI